MSNRFSRNSTPYNSLPAQPPVAQGSIQPAEGGGSGIVSSAGMAAQPVWRAYLWATLPPFALLALALALAQAPLPQQFGKVTTTPTSSEPEANTPQAALPPADMVVPVTETFVVAPEGSHILLRGVTEKPAGKPMPAPLPGQVARVAVKTGQVVQSGQEIVALSTRAVSDSAPPMPSPNRSSYAERAQVAAVRAQQSWQDRVREAHDRLLAAQKRVEDAKVRVASARDMVTRLQKGETVDESSLKKPEPAAPRQVSGPTTSALEAATKESRRLQSVADNAALAAASARRTAVNAEQAAKNKQKQWQDAQSAVDKIEVTKPESNAPAEAGTEAGKDTPAPRDDGSAARKRLAQERANNVKGMADDAVGRAADLRRDANRLATRATSTQNKANDAARRVAEMRGLRIFENDESTTSDSTRSVRSGDGKGVTLAQAAQIAREAIEESRAAAADADRIQKEVRDYERPVERTREKIDIANQRLNAAQEQMWDRGPAVQPNLTPVLAPEPGVVLWVAELAREVQPGEVLATVGRADRLEVVLRDTSSAWKNLKTGSFVMTLVQDIAPAEKIKTASLHTSPKYTVQVGKMRGVPTLARVLFVAPPSRAGAPALIRVAIHNPRRPDLAKMKNPNYGLAGRIFGPGTPVMCSLARPNAANKKAGALAIPSAAIRSDAQGNPYVAVLAPVDPSGRDANDLCRIEWRKVELGRSDGFQNVVRGGLKPGERIALRPDAMQNLMLSHGAQATLRIEQA